MLVLNKMLASTASGGGGAELGQFGDRLPRWRPQLAFLCTYSSSIHTGIALPSCIMFIDTIHYSDISDVPNDSPTIDTRELYKEERGALTTL